MHPDDTFELSFVDWMIFTVPDPSNIFKPSLAPTIWTERHGEDINEIVFYNTLNILAAGFLVLGSSGTANSWGAYQIYQRAKFARWLVTNPLVMVPVATVVGAEAYMSVMTKYAPHEHHEQPSYWRAIAQAIGAGGVGVGTGADSYV